MMAEKIKKRCAIYTRKSTEEGLDQDFNSLDAQREAAEHHIRAQAHEGWVLLPSRYDDGGFSGGSMERPAVKRLIQDIEDGLIDVVVVYKIDRLSRSMADFMKIMELFDKQKVSFVSVTQHFNTDTSMGRLTLNILQSFAQFEREMTAERIRDKFAASKRKGMWMGGVPPLGYDVHNRKLEINPDEAEIVQFIFKRFLEMGSATQLVGELKEKGYQSKSWVARSGRSIPENPSQKALFTKFWTTRFILERSAIKARSTKASMSVLLIPPILTRPKKSEKIECQIHRRYAAHRLSIFCADWFLMPKVTPSHVPP